MKNLITILIVLACFSTEANVQGGINAILDAKTFYIPGEGAFLETYFEVKGESVVFKKNDNNKLQSKIEISWKFEDENELVVHFDKYVLHSPERELDGVLDFDFLDQQRFPLKNGTYSYELIIKDLNSERESATVVSEVEIAFYPDIIGMSDIQLLKSYKPATAESKIAKNGFDLMPKIDGLYKQEEELIFYTEIYNADKKLGEKPYLLSYFIQSSESKQILENFKVYKRKTPERITVILSTFSISDLPSGNYELVVELRDQSNVLIGYKEEYFQRSNKKFSEATLTAEDFENVNIHNTFASKITDKEQLMEFIHCLRPISTPQEQIFEDNQLKMANEEMMQKFFYDFWNKRSAVNPEAAWLTYYEEVKKVNSSYGTRIQKGYETDRGRVYLEYGPPNTISKHYAEPSAYPYEIWHYYRLGKQSNRKFIYYNPDLVSQDFRLLHSDANGEEHEPRWQMILHERNNASRDMDKTKVNESYGGHSDDFFNNPR
ncbi:MAG: GWxTD domain-containing protein [Bacteroidia bacterium]|nr:GWxTD domain-containing protein [Bacteroidia bacterium]